MVSKPWSWLTGLAVLFAGLTNAHSHVHYCFDGQEPPAAVHLVDGVDHDHGHGLLGHNDAAEHGHDTAHDDDADAEHDDLDVDVPNQALGKVFKHELPAIVASAWTTSFESLPGAALAAEVQIAPAPDPRYTLPPQRAPPR